MLKVRIQGTVYDLNWAMEEMEKSDKLTVLSMSKILPNKDSKKFYHIYADVEKQEKTS